MLWASSWSLITQVTSINPRYAKVHILYVGSTPLKDRFRGTIRYSQLWLNSSTVFFFVFQCFPKKTLFFYSNVEKKMYVQQKRTRYVRTRSVCCNNLLFLFYFHCFHFLGHYITKTEMRNFIYIVLCTLTGGDIQKFQTWWHCPCKSGILLSVNINIGQLEKWMLVKWYANKQANTP